MRWSVMLTVLAMACKAPVDPFDPDEEATVPGWIDSELSGQEDACSSSPLWADPQAHVATTFYAGTYQLDGDDVYGNEFWFLWPDPDLAEGGFEACTVVWDIIGTRGDRVRAGDYSIEISALIDEAQTDCGADANGATVFEGEESFVVTYDVLEQGNDVQVFFANSGNPVGRGETRNNGFSWLSEKDCKLF